MVTPWFTSGANELNHLLHGYVINFEQKWQIVPKKIEQSIRSLHFSSQLR